MITKIVPLRNQKSANIFLSSPQIITTKIFITTMKHYLLKCIALMLVGSLAISCGKDDQFEGDDDIVSISDSNDNSDGKSGDNSGSNSEDNSGNNNSGDNSGNNSGNNNSGNNNSGNNNSGSNSDNDSGNNNSATPEKIVPVNINATTFPDPKFRALISGHDYDRNGDGYLDEKEIIYIRNIYCQGMGIKSLKGIEYLKELRGIYCMDNEIADWDLSHNKLLTGIWCSNNKFKSLDFSGLDDLVWVYCHDCKELTSLNVKNNPKMAYIECNTTPLKELDVTHNPELEHLMCGTCGLKTLDLSKNPKLQHLDAFSNKFTSLDLSHNPLLKRLDIWNNQQLGNVSINHLKGLQTYNCAKTGIKKLDVSHLPELYKLICSYNQITTLDLSKNPKLIILECQDNSLTQLNISKNPQLRFLWAAHNKFSSIDLSSNPYLVKVYNEGIYEKDTKYGIDHEWYINLGGDVSTGDDNKLYLWVNIDVKINAKSNGTPAAKEKYSPLDPGVKESDCLTRGYVMNYLYKMAGSPNVAGHKSSFKDVAGTTYEKAIIWGEMRAMTMGFPEFLGDYFAPNKWITRQDLTFMLMRYAEALNLKREIDFGRSDEYLDYFDIDYDHWEAICWCATWHIIEGKGGATKSQQKFDPFGRVTQADLNLAIANLKDANK